MIKDLAGVGWQDLGAGGLVILAVLLVMTGRIVPRQTYQDMERQRDKWEAAWRESQAALIARDAQLDEVVEAMRTMSAAFASVRLRDRP